MNRILFYISPGSDEEYSSIITLAADLVEAATYSGHKASHEMLLGIVAPIRACVEIALATLGRGEARTVEQGIREASPVRIFPFVTAGDGDAGAWREALEYLRSAGAIEGQTDDNPARDSLRQFRSANDALSSARQLTLWEGIVVLGANVDVRLIAAGRDTGGVGQPPPVIRPIDLEFAREEAKAYVVPETDKLRETDLMREVRLRASAEALRFARLVDQLRLDPE